jgi:hypothetical protein
MPVDQGLGQDFGFHGAGSPGAESLVRGGNQFGATIVIVDGIRAQVTDR